MPRNIELKARLGDLSAAIATAERLCAAEPQIERQIDTYFHCRNGRLKLREIEGRETQLVWYQRPDRPAAKGSDYFLVPVADPAALKTALAGALGVRGVVSKRRQIYLHENVRIHLDEVKGTGCFLEFEAVLAPEMNDDFGRRQLDELQRLFAIPDGDLLSGSYSDMLVPPEP